MACVHKKSWRISQQITSSESTATFSHFFCSVLQPNRSERCPLSRRRITLVMRHCSVFRFSSTDDAIMTNWFESIRLNAIELQRETSVQELWFYIEGWILAFSQEWGVAVNTGLELPFNLRYTVQESRAVARKPRDAAAVLLGLKFADNIHYKFKSSQASKARLHSSKHTGTKQNLRQTAIQGHLTSRVLESVEMR